MNVGLILAAAAIVFIAVKVLWDIGIRKTKRTVFNLILVAVSFVAALIGTIVLRNYLTLETIKPYLDMLSLGEYAAILEGEGVSGAADSVLSLVSGLISPIIFILLFIVLRIITCIVYFIFMLCTIGHKGKGGILCLVSAIVTGVIVVVAFMIPITFYAEVVTEATTVLMEDDEEETTNVSASLPKSDKTSYLSEEATLDTSSTIGETEDSTEAVEDSENEVTQENPLDSLGLDAYMPYVESVSGAFTTTMFKTFGGLDLINSLTNVRVNGEKYPMLNSGVGKNDGQITSLAAVVKSAMPLTSMTSLDTEACNNISNVLDSAQASDFLSGILGNVLYDVTTAWYNNGTYDGSYMNVAMPEVPELLEDFIHDLFDILRVDSKDAMDGKTVGEDENGKKITQLSEDLKTTTLLLKDLAESGALDGELSSDDFFTKISGEVIGNMVYHLGQNDSMKVLIPDILNVGLRAVSSSISLPDDVDAVYGKLIDDCTAALADVMALTGDEQKAALSEKLTTAFDEAGIEMDAEVVTLFAETMAQDLLSSGTAPTEEDVQAFFAAYASESDVEETNSGELAVKGKLSTSDKDSIYFGTIYTGKDLSTTAAGKLAKLFADIKNANGDKAIIAQKLATYYGKTASEMDALATKFAAKKDTMQDIINTTASMKSAKDLITQVITLKDLLIDVDEFKNNLTADKLNAEKDAIASLMGSLVSIMKDGFENVELETLTSALGGALESLKTTVSFGGGRVDNLFVAFLQSKTVRDNANINLITATKMAKAGAGANMSNMLNTVSKAAELFSEDGISEEGLVALLEGIDGNTAEMISVFVTPERMQDFGVSNSEEAEKISNLLVNTLDFVGNNDIDVAKEAKAISNITSLMDTAKDGASSGKLFSDGEGEGALPSAEETISTLMESQALANALKSELCDESGNITETNPFGFQELAPEEETALNNAINNYYDQHKTEEGCKDNLELYAAMLGLSVTLG